MSLTTVPNITIGPPVVTCLRKAVPRSRAFFDCHMMVSNPDQWVDVFAEAGAGLSPSNFPHNLFTQELMSPSVSGKYLHT